MTTKKVKKVVKPEFPEELYVYKYRWGECFVIAEKLKDAFDADGSKNRVGVYKLVKFGNLEQTLEVVED